MQGVTVSWVGQSFALPKCSASRENKSRIRRTKEERRTMVVSFIKKYQSSNNGKFPSLNLTHKAVGGSFYTVREIVREIIQENKVLGPGNPSSKLLNLQYYSEEEADNGSFLDDHGSLSIFAIANEIDHVHYNYDSSMEQEEVSSEENVATDKPGVQVKFKTDLNENFSWQVKNDETNLKEDSANGSVLQEKLVNTGTKESNIQSLTAKKDDTWGCDEQINAEVKPNSPEEIDIQFTKKSLSLYPTVSGAFLVESKQRNEDAHKQISVTTHCFEESTNISEASVTESLPGTSMRFSGIVDDHSNWGVGHDNHEVSKLVDDTLEQDGSSETVVESLTGTSMRLRGIVDDHSNRGVGHDNHEVSTLVDDTVDQDGSSETVVESLPGTSMRFTGIVDDHSNGGVGHDNQELLTLVDDTLDQDGSSETVVLAVSNTPQISRSAHKVHLPSETFVKGTVINSSELETEGLNRENASNSSPANKADIPSIPFDKEPFTSIAQSGEIVLSSEQGIFDVAVGKSVDNFVLQTRSPATGATENDIQLVCKSSIFVDAVKESENASIKLLEPVMQAADHSDFKSEKQSDAFSTLNGGGFIRPSNEEATKEPAMLKTNPFWAAIKAFVSSFIKFWSE